MAVLQPLTTSITRVNISKSINAAPNNDMSENLSSKHPSCVQLEGNRENVTTTTHIRPPSGIMIPLAPISHFPLPTPFSHSLAVKSGLLGS